MHEDEREAQQAEVRAELTECSRAGEAEGGTGEKCQ